MAWFDAAQSLSRLLEPQQTHPTLGKGCLTAVQHTGQLQRLVTCTAMLTKPG